MTTTRSSSATSCCKYGMLNGQLQGWRTKMAELIVGEKASPSTPLIKRWIELKVCIIIITQISHYCYRWDRLHSIYFYLSFQTLVALWGVSDRGVWTAHDLQQPDTETDMRWCCISITPQHMYGYKNAVVRTPNIDIFVILLCHAHAIKQAYCIPWYRVRETLATNQSLWCIPWRRLLCDASWDVCIQWRRLHQCLQWEGGRWAPEKTGEEPLDS